MFVNQVVYTPGMTHGAWCRHGCVQGGGVPTNGGREGYIQGGIASPTYPGWYMALPSLPGLSKRPSLASQDCQRGPF